MTGKSVLSRTFLIVWIALFGQGAVTLEQTGPMQQYGSTSNLDKNVRQLSLWFVQWLSALHGTRYIKRLCVMNMMKQQTKYEQNQLHKYTVLQTLNAQL